MKTSQYFPLVVSSLIVSGGMLFSTPAQSLIFQGTTVSTSSFPTIGNRFVVSGLGGSPLTVNSLTSPQFPVTQIDNNNTTAVAVSTVGGVIELGDTNSIIIDVADNPAGPSGIIFLESASIIATPTGTEEVPLPTFTITASNSAGASTPFSAYKFVFSTVLEGQPFDATALVQIPGDQITFSDSSLIGLVAISSQAIPGYVPFEQLNNFSPPTEFTLTPGGSITTVVSPQVTTTPEPSVVASLSALSFGAFLKRKLLKKHSKAS